MVGGIDPERPVTEIQAEPGVPADDLRAAGFDVTPLPARSEHVGHTQAVWRLERGQRSARGRPRALSSAHMLPRWHGSG